MSKATTKVYSVRHISHINNKYSVGWRVNDRQIGLYSSLESAKDSAITEIKRLENHEWIMSRKRTVGFVEKYIDKYGSYTNDIFKYDEIVSIVEIELLD